MSQTTIEDLLAMLSGGEARLSGPTSSPFGVARPGPGAAYMLPEMDPRAVTRARRSLPEAGEYEPSPDELQQRRSMGVPEYRDASARSGIDPEAVAAMFEQPFAGAPQSPGALYYKLFAGKGEGLADLLVTSAPGVPINWRSTSRSEQGAGRAYARAPRASKAPRPRAMGASDLLGPGLTLKPEVEKLARELLGVSGPSDPLVNRKTGRLGGRGTAMNSDLVDLLVERMRRELGFEDPVVGAKEVQAEAFAEALLRDMEAAINGIGVKPGDDEFYGRSARAFNEVLPEIGSVVGEGGPTPGLRAAGQLVSRAKGAPAVAAAHSAALSAGTDPVSETDMNTPAFLRMIKNRISGMDPVAAALDPQVGGYTFKYSPNPATGRVEHLLNPEGKPINVHRHGKQKWPIHERIAKILSPSDASLGPEEQLAVQSAFLTGLHPVEVDTPMEGDILSRMQQQLEQAKKTGWVDMRKVK